LINTLPRSPRSSSILSWAGAGMPLVVVWLFNAGIAKKKKKTQQPLMTSKGNHHSSHIHLLTCSIARLLCLTASFYKSDDADILLSGSRQLLLPSCPFRPAPALSRLAVDSGGYIRSSTAERAFLWLMTVTTCRRRHGIGLQLSPSVFNG
jgi:hypothetical protein